ncbi:MULTISPECIES: hypothetical protein [Agrobacterium]|uniref:hypothetical protein n=1 Tax=Agrobacterium TaxID=357 RepID=UPI000DD33C77|nr:MULTISPECIES: hypothetical protein [Agrobacterium]MBO9108022.1 hypothetical protein [Agrobacterium sp. S2/73]NTA15250.1 hypothetical protein [Agrobacterium tumefaciens]NTA80181.1 hypothetical protein [Agrobacterium tumefaciens]QXZ71385.1 hypothetical protein J5276_09715 [Agrobacterium sp. S7/73]WCK71488.1 hypothetical protein G6L96_003200 [Agrobacterium tumefaciens]
MISDIYDGLRELANALGDMRALQDLQAQLDMAYWAQAMFWSSVGGCIASVVAIFLAGGTYIQSTRAISLTRQIGENQTQAYVLASKAEFGSKGNILITCSNNGETPAAYFSVNASAKVVQPGNVTASISFIDDEYKTWSALAAHSELSVTVLDSDPVVADFRRAPYTEDLLLISGQVVYRTIFGHDHLTQFAFFVTKGSSRFRRPTGKLDTFRRLPQEPSATLRQHVDVVLEDDEKQP